jgi:oxygen-independent coproporphyrinogen III oxidase
MKQIPLGLYLHIPFCLQRCRYCDFNTFAGLDHLMLPFVQSIQMEISRMAHYQEWGPVATLYFGGGTPTTLAAGSLSAILASIHDHFAVQPDAEISIEANPETLSPANLTEIRAAGFNRLSIGVQSLKDSELQFLGRIHSAEKARAAVREAMATGFDSINCDFIFGLPGQSLSSWLESLSKGLSFGVQHFSLYNLTIEEGTPLGQWLSDGRFALPDADLAADMYQQADTLLLQAGYHHYEISNWARPGHECRHNLNYWHNHNWLGFGPGAHSHLDGYRWWNIAGLKDYIDKIADNPANPPAFAGSENLGLDNQLAETMILGLRLIEEGVSRSSIRERFHIELSHRYGKEISWLLDNQLVEWRGDHLVLTGRGALLGNQVFAQFVL